MMMGRGGGNAADGGLAHHIPVLAAEAVALLAPRDGGVYIDGTFGAGGYSRALLAAAHCQVIGIDRDPRAIARGDALVAASEGRLALVQGRFSELDNIARASGHERVVGVVLDIGVSSMQLDEANRGFSFRYDAPLDMRMGADGPTAAELIAVASERDLANIIATLGEERFARPIARAIVRGRAQSAIVTTRQLVSIIETVVHARPGLIHPATRTFQALRIFLNEELMELAQALAAAERALEPGGRLVVVSFHSLEDRIVKTFLNDRSRARTGSRHAPEVAAPAPSFSPLTRKPVVASEEEIAANPRARSAKLRAAERMQAPARPLDAGALLPRLPSLQDVMRRK